MSVFTNIKIFLAKKFDSLYFFYTYLRSKLFVLLILNFVMVLLDSIGISMFIPLIQVAIKGNNTTDQDKLTIFVQKVFSYLHLDITPANMLIFIILVFVIKAFITYISLSYQTVAQQYIIKDIRIRLSKGLGKLSYKEFVHTDVGRLQNSLTGESYRVVIACKQYFEVIKNLMIIAVYFSFAVFMDWRFSILILLGGVITNGNYRFFLHQNQRVITGNYKE